MTLILHWHQGGWYVHYQDLHLSVPLSFLDWYDALEGLRRLYPDAQIVIDRIELKEAACVLREWRVASGRAAAVSGRPDRKLRVPPRSAPQ